MQHGGVNSAIPKQQEVSWIKHGWVLSVFVTFPLPVWVFFRCSAFLPQSTGSQFQDWLKTLFSTIWSILVDLKSIWLDTGQIWSRKALMYKYLQHRYNCITFLHILICVCFGPLKEKSSNEAKNDKVTFENNKRKVKKTKSGRMTEPQHIAPQISNHSTESSEICKIG